MQIATLRVVRAQPSAVASGGGKRGGLGRPVAGSPVVGAGVSGAAGSGASLRCPPLARGVAVSSCGEGRAQVSGAAWVLGGGVETAVTPGSVGGDEGPGSVAAAVPGGGRGGVGRGAVSQLAGAGARWCECCRVEGRAAWEFGGGLGRASGGGASGSCGGCRIVEAGVAGGAVLPEEDSGSISPAGCLTAKEGGDWGRAAMAVVLDSGGGVIEAVRWACPCGAGVLAWANSRWCGPVCDFGDFGSTSPARCLTAARSGGGWVRTVVTARLTNGGGAAAALCGAG